MFVLYYLDFLVSELINYEETRIKYSELNYKISILQFLRSDEYIYFTIMCFFS